MDLSGTVFAAPQTVARSRVAWIDVARGIGILLVVYGHALRALFPVGTDWPAWIMAQDRVIYAFHMPLFFVLAGLFVERGLAKGRDGFIRDKLARIAWPYLLWSLVAGGLELAFASRVNSPIGWQDLALLPVRPIEQFWFLYALFLCQMIAVAVLPGQWRLALATALAVAAAMLVLPPIWPILSVALLNLPYFAAGILAGSALLRLPKAPRATLAIIAAAAWATFAVLLALPVPPAIEAGFTYLPALAGTLATMASAALVARYALARPLALLGAASMAIFVMHSIASAGTRILLKTASLAPAPVLMLALCTAAGILFPLIAWVIAERLGWGRALGIGRGIAEARAGVREASPARLAGCG